MSTVRTVGLSWVMMALAMLPAGRLAVPGPSDNRVPPARTGTSAAAHDAPDTRDNSISTPDSGAKKPASPEEPIFVHPAMDVWDANASRAAGSARPAHDLVSLPPLCPEGVVVTFGEARWLGVTSQRWGDPSQSLWWVCVYPHAPPGLG